MRRNAWVGLALMALSYAFGAILWAAADTAGHTYTVSGLSFQPKALRFSSGVSTITDREAAADLARSMGFATGTADRRCVAVWSVDGGASSDCVSGCRNDAVLAFLSDTPGFDGLLDLTAVNSDGFVLTVDQQAGAHDVGVLWEVWGGSDITAVGTVEIAEPAATGDQDYTITGFTAGGTDQVVMLAGIQTNATNTAARQDSGFCVGFATGASSAQCVVVGNADDASATMDTDGYCQTGECLAQIVIGGGTSVNAHAALTQFNTDGFRLNWGARAVTGRRSIALGIKGGSWTAGALTLNGNAGGATASVSGLSYAPIGLSLIGRMTAQDTADTATTQDRISVGMGTGATTRQCWGGLDEDATANAEPDVVLETDQVLAYPSTTGTLQTAYDIQSLDSGGFTLVVDTAGGVASEWIGYLTFGNAPAVVASGVPTIGLMRMRRRLLGDG